MNEELITITISKQKMENYISNSIILNCLWCDGVDNWECYGESFPEEDELQIQIEKELEQYLK